MGTAEGDRMGDSTGLTIFFRLYFIWHDCGLEQLVLVSFSSITLSHYQCQHAIS